MGIAQYFQNSSFLEIYLVTSLVALLWYHLIAESAFYYLYIKKRHAEWKTQSTYPSRKKVLDEAIGGTICVWAATLNVALAIYFSNHGRGYLIRDWRDASPFYHMFSIFTLIVIMEIFEWWFHWFSHRNKILWKIHRKHHIYPNPTPYAVLSDHPIDMWIKSSPFLWVPFFFPIWDVALIGWFAFVNFIFGTYLHSGFEFPFLPSRHSKFFVSSWHHNAHHSLNTTKNFGFFTGMMDIIFGTRYTPSDQEEQDQVKNFYVRVRVK